MEVIVINGFTRIREVEKFFKRLDPKVFKCRLDITLKELGDILTSINKPCDIQIIYSEILSNGIIEGLENVKYKYISFQDILSKKETLPEPMKGDVGKELLLAHALKKMFEDF